MAVILILYYNLLGLEENILALDSEAQKRGLRINEPKTKYMGLQRNVTNNPPYQSVGNYTFERVHQFSYLGSQMVRTTHATMK